MNDLEKRDEGWARPYLRMQKYHYFRKGKSLCGFYYYRGEQLFDDVSKEQCCVVCLRNLRHPEVYRIANLLYSRKIKKLFKVMEKYRDHLQYPLEQHVQHLLSEVEEFKEAYEQNDIPEMIEELIDISSMCDLIYDKLKHEKRTFH